MMKTEIRIALSVVVFVSLIGCGEMPTDDEDTITEGAATVRTNGLAMINGLALANGLAMANGLALANGLTSTAGLSSTTGLMTTGMGRRTVAYLARCALSTSQKLPKQDQFGTNYTYPGDLGLAPGWYTGSISATEQQSVSACMMAHLNTAGLHVPIWLDSGASPIGWGRSSSYPNMEGTFFGNIMTTASDGKVTGFFCEGSGFAKGIVPGRLGASQIGTPYRNPWGAGAMCDDHCTKYGSEGYSTCDGFKNPITVWRAASYRPVFDDKYTYKLINSKSHLALDVLNWSQDNGAQLVQWTDHGGTNQQFQIVQVSSSQWKIVNVNSGKAVTNRNGSSVTQNSYSGSNADIWSIDDHNGHFKIVNKATGDALKSPGSSLTAAIVTDDYEGASDTDWDIFAVTSLN